MQAARLYGARDLRVEDAPPPRDPAAGEAMIRMMAVGVCGSDLHTYLDARIGDTAVQAPLVLGHEFAGVIEAVGEDARDGHEWPLAIGQRVAVDPANPCWRCEFCEGGHPNLCRRMHFCGLYPDDGALQTRMIVAARGCFPLPDGLSDAAGALLEPMGVALHAVDLAKLRLARSVAVIGCGAIGLLIIALARRAGADPIYAFDRLSWRAAQARVWGASAAWTVRGAAEPDGVDPVTAIAEVTHGRGVDTAIEAGWADESIAWAAEMACLGGRVVLVGIPGDDRFALKHSTARRKGLTIVMARRMRHTYPRAIHLATAAPDPIDLDHLISHRFPLARAPEAFALNADYRDEVVKVVIEP